VDGERGIPEIIRSHFLNIASDGLHFWYDQLWTNRKLRIQCATGIQLTYLGQIHWFTRNLRYHLSYCPFGRVSASRRRGAYPLSRMQESDIHGP
jgi:hypothetical protein